MFSGCGRFAAPELQASEIQSLPDSVRFPKRTFGRSCRHALQRAYWKVQSVSFPRLSPDGRFLAFTLHDFGNFSIWHKEADLYMLDLLTSRKYPLDVFNSEEAESYHSWSGNGRWMVFSSRRIDGLYTRLFIGYVDSEGVGHKPFLLPQKDPLTYYDALMFSYNIPELMRSAVTVDACRLAGC